MTTTRQNLAGENRALREALQREREQRRRAEAHCRLLEARLRVSGDAAAIAHQVRNPLFGIEGFAELAQERHRDDPKLRRWIARILESVRGINHALSTLEELGQTAPPQPEATTSEELLDGALAVLRAEAPEAHARISWQRHLPASPRPIVDSTLSKEALLHLLRNAAEAGANRVRVSSRGSRAGGIEFLIEDDGEGIPEALRERIRRLFFTTRCGADGIGLNRVEQIALLHHGALTLETRPGGGTRARLWLGDLASPAADGTSAREEFGAAAPPPSATSPMAPATAGISPQTAPRAGGGTRIE
jgi:signal transduction histidine kinase